MQKSIVFPQQYKKLAITIMTITQLVSKQPKQWLFQPLHINDSSGQHETLTQYTHRREVKIKCKGDSTKKIADVPSSSSSQPLSSGLNSRCLCRPTLPLLQ
jgi:hypothetical protein